MTRRKVMAEFGKYLDTVEWFGQMKRREAPVPEGFTLADVARAVNTRRANYIKEMHKYLGYAEEDDQTFEG
jgi:hypothetical protein